VDLEDNEYSSTTASTIEDAQKLLEDGWEYVTTYNDVMLFRKRK